MASPLPAPLPARLGAALEQFRHHIEAERGLSRHTVRAYLGDVTSLLEHAAAAGATAPADLDIGALRAWLAGQHGSGHSGATLARRAAAVRTFSAFAHARGLLAADPGPLLGMPRIPRRLPEVLRQDQVAAVLDAPGTPMAARPGGTPSRRDAALVLRDTAIVELLYASGIRVSELCGLDIGDLDTERRTVRAPGPGHPRQRACAVPGGAGQAPRPADGAARGARTPGRSARNARLGPARAAPRGCNPPARRRRRSAQRAGDPGARVADKHADLHARHGGTAPVRLPAGAPARVRR